MFTDVLIVGAGPVGLALGCLLRSQNVQCTIVEKNLKRTSHSKAISINSASLQVLNILGLANEVVSRGNKISAINVFNNSNLFYSLNYNHLKNANLSDFPYLITLPQPEIESLLEEKFLSLGGKIEKNKEFASFYKNNKSNTYISNITDLSEQKSDKYFSKYIVGCDGIKSVVRKNLSLDFQGEQYDIGFILGDFNISFDNESIKTNLNEVNYHTNGTEFLLIVPLENGLYRIVIQVKKEDIESKYTNININDFQNILYERNFKIRINSGKSLSATKLYNLFCNTIKHENIFLAGDAFHQFSPIGGLGMNTGFQDIFNLAWKIEHNIKNTVFKNELHTYESERLPIVQSLNKSTCLSTKALLYKNNLSTDIIDLINQLKNSHENKVFRENIFPLRMSGIAQKYNYNYSRFSGNFLFKNFNDNNLCYKHNLLIFSKESDQVHKLIEMHLNNFLDIIEVKFINCQDNEQINGFEYIDVNNSFFFLRPDKMIEFNEKIENLHLLKKTSI